MSNIYIGNMSSSMFTSLFILVSITACFIGQLSPNKKAVASNQTTNINCVHLGVLRILPIDTFNTTNQNHKII